MNRDHVRRVLGSIRARFVFFFLVGTLLTVALASVMSYYTMYCVIARINGRTTQAEFAQISAHLSELYDNINRQMDTLAYDTATKPLFNFDAYSELEVTYAVIDFSHTVGTMILNFPYIQSVYLFLPDDRAVCFTSSNVRHFFNDWDPKPSERVFGSVLQSASRHLLLIGGITTADYPLFDDQKDAIPLISAVRVVGNATLVINITEAQLQSHYIGISQNSNCFIRIIDNDGMIVSSINSTELGGAYDGFNTIAIDHAGEITLTNEKMQVFWFPIGTIGLTIVNEISLRDYWADLSLVQRNVIIIFLTGYALTCILFFIWMSKVFAPLNRILESMKHAGAGRYDHTLPVRGCDELSTLVSHYNRMLDNLRQLAQNNEHMERLRRESELRALRNQINPHFLYNTLNTIKWMAVIARNPGIADCISSLGGLIAPMFKTLEPLCTLREELHTVALYLNIMNLRYGNGVDFTADIGDGLEDIRVLRFILQPIIENAISHGFSTRNHHGHILLKAFVEEGALVLQVIDNGTGLAEDELARMNALLSSNEETECIGMINTARRIVLQYGSAYGIRLSANEGDGLCVTLRLPYLYNNEDREVSNQV